MNTEELVLLVKKAQSGDTNAFGTIYQLTGKSVYFNCLKLSGNEQTAQDVLQNAYLKAFERLNTLAYPENFLAWINRIAINECKAYFAKASKAQPIDGEFAESIPDEGLIPEDFVENDAKRKIIMDIIDNSLTATQRQTVILYYYNSMSVESIANIMDCPEGTVLSRLNSARKKLREAVLIYEDKNNDRLHAIAPVGILGMIFKAEEQKLTLPKMSFAEFSSANAVQSQRINIKNATNATKPGGKGMLSTLKARIIAGVAALLVVGGAITAGVIISSDDDSDRRRDDDDDKKISAEIDEDDEDDRDNEESEYDEEDSSSEESDDDLSEESKESDDESDSDNSESIPSQDEETEYPEFEGLEVIKLAGYTEDGEGADVISGRIVDVYNEVSSVDHNFILLDDQGNIYYYYPYSSSAYEIKTIGENTSITKFDDIAFFYNQERFVALDGKTIFVKVLAETNTWYYDEPTIVLEGEGTLYEDIENLETIKISRSGFDLYAKDSSGFWYTAKSFYDTKYPDPIDGGLGFFHNALDTFANLEYYGIEVVDIIDGYFALSDGGRIHEINTAADEEPIEGSEIYTFVRVFENESRAMGANALGLTDDNRIIVMSERGTVQFEEECPEGTLENVWMSSDIMTIKMDTGYYTASIGWGDEAVDTTFYPCDALNNVADQIVRITSRGNVLLSNGYLYDYIAD